MVDVEERVVVYQYMYWDNATNSRKKSKLYAPAELIKNGLGEPIYTSGRDIPRSWLIDGIFVPDR